MEVKLFAPLRVKPGTAWIIEDVCAVSPLRS
jgi:hypothetical protein